jgi:serine/threonine-protein kinase
MASPTVTQALIKAKDGAHRHGGGRSMGGLSPEIQAQAAQRLGTIAALMCGMFVLSTIIRNVVFRVDSAGFGLQQLRVANVYSAIYAVVCLALYLYARRSTAYRTVLRVGLVFEVVTCMSVAFLETWLNADAPSEGVRLSLVALFLLIFPATIPARTGVRVATTTISFASLPLAFWVTAMMGRPTEHVAFVLLPTFVAALGGIAVSRIVHGLSVQLTEAQTLGAYQLVKKLGAGGMGEVWLGKHQMLMRPAAIKIVSAESLGEDAETAIRRFEREAQATSVLRSPHTVELYDFGVSDNGTFYYAMELLEGQDLESLVEEHGPLPAGRVIHILEQVCQSLEDAHRHRLVHRDIKPANVFICRLGNEVDFVKVLDFGLVKPESDIEVSANNLNLSQENIIAGTPAYMAPELALSTKVGHGIDIYALGCVGYYLLTGELVFTGKTAMEVALKHVKEAPTPPSERTEVPVPKDLEELVLACLEKDPTNRPRTATAVRERLQELAKIHPWTKADAEAWWRVSLPELMAAPKPGVSSSLGPRPPDASMS